MSHNCRARRNEPSLSNQNRALAVRDVKTEKFADSNGIISEVLA